jgi:hypothetical protein
MFAASKTSRAAVAAQADPFFDNVTTLLESTGTNGAQNNTFIDSSTNNFTITRNGNTTQGAFSPFGENWSNYFDGTGDFLTVPDSTQFRIGTDSFTIDLWLYKTTNATPQSVFSIGPNNTAGYGLIFFDALARLRFATGGSGAAILSDTQDFPLLQWVHVALVRNGTQLTLFINGESRATTTWSTSWNPSGGQVTSIGQWVDGTSFRYGPGYISNLRLVNGTALYTANFTPSTVPLQPVAGTSLLTCKDPSIVDDSANQFTITRTGDVSVQKFGPFAGTTLPTPYYGAYFAGSNSYIQVPDNAGFAFGSGDFTIEYWFNAPQVTTSMFVYGQISAALSTASRNVYDSIGSGIVVTQLFGATGQLGQINSSVTVSPNTWYHVAVTRNAGEVRQFINGQQTGSFSIGSTALNDSDVPFSIGRIGEYDLNTYTGYISNFRVVKGQALYTSNFTPSTIPLTTTSQGATASNVSLLTCQSATFIDNSTNNFAITAVGNSTPTAFAPFPVVYETEQSYTPAVFGGSGYFDGSGDYVSAPANAAFQLTGDFTVEAWVYPTAVNSFNMVFGSESGTNSDYLSIRASTLELAVAATAFPVWTRAFVVNQWYHVAVTRQSSTLRAFVNGIQLTLSSGSATNSSQLFQSGAALSVGRYGNTSTPHAFTGYISGARVVKGTALYTSSFVPQNAPLTAVTNTSLLLNATNAGIYDASTLNVFETVGNAQVSTSIKKYGLSSIAFDGAGDYLLAPSNPSMDFRGSFTIEMWVNFVNVNSTWQSIISRAYGVAGGWRLYKNDGNNQLRWYSSTTSVVLTTGSTLANNTWSHIALVRNSGVITIYIDGVSRGSASNTTSYVPGNYALEIGQGVVTSTFPMNGYIQDLRITNGIARYTANFTPPPALFPEF